MGGIGYGKEKCCDWGWVNAAVRGNYAVFCNSNVGGGEIAAGKHESGEYSRAVKRMKREEWMAREEDIDKRASPMYPYFLLGSYAVQMFLVFAAPLLWQELVDGIEMREIRVEPDPDLEGFFPSGGSGSNDITLGLLADCLP